MPEDEKPQEETYPEPGEEKEPDKEPEKFVRTLNKEIIEEVVAAVELVTKYDEGGRNKVFEILPDEFTIDELKEAMKKRRPDESVQPKI